MVVLWLASFRGEDEDEEGDLRLVWLMDYGYVWYFNGIWILCRTHLYVYGILQSTSFVFVMINETCSSPVKRAK